MNIQNNPTQTSFQAKFLHTEDLYNIADYAVKHNKFKELNNARKVFEAADPRTRVAVDLCYTGKKPTIIFSYYVPNPARSGMFADEFVLANQTDIIAKKSNEDIIKFGLRQIISIAKQGPNSHQFKEIFKRSKDNGVFIWI